MRNDLFPGERAHANNIEPGSAISNGREPKSCLGRVFNFKLGCFDEQKHE